MAIIVAVKQLVDDFARYLYLPRIAGPEVLAQAIRDGVALLTWRADTFALCRELRRSGGALSRLAGRARDQYLSRQPGLARQAGCREQAIGCGAPLRPFRSSTQPTVSGVDEDTHLPDAHETHAGPADRSVHPFPRLGARRFSARRTRCRPHCR